MNHMAEVAQILGVELGENFSIKGYDSKYKITDDGLLALYDSICGWEPTDYLLNRILRGHLEIIKIPKPVLDEVERKYLSNIIKPFRSQVQYIRKRSDYKENSECILIMCKDYDSGEKRAFSLPYFKKDTMYKGMEIEKDYTLDELNL